MDPKAIHEKLVARFGDKITAVNLDGEFAEVVTREAARILKCSPDVVDIVFCDTDTENWANGGRLAADKQSKV